MMRLKSRLLGLGLIASVSGTALAAMVTTAEPAASAAPAGPAVFVNGQMLISFGHRAPHIHNDRVYVAVADFAWLTGAPFQWDATTSSLTFNGKAVTYGWEPAPHIHDDTVYAPVRVLADLIGGTVAWDGARQAVSIEFAGQTPAQKLGLPRGYARATPVVPMMGEHWMNMLDPYMTPIYLVYNGKLIGWEVMPTQADLNAGKSWNDLGLVNTGPINHVDFSFVPNGHEGLPVPHYDVHAYTITPAEKQAIK
jgi:hypothetical protein